MSTLSFRNEQRQTQINWRKTHILPSKSGYQNGKAFPHIIPHNLWNETLWQGIKSDLPNYLKEEDIKPHSGTHNLLSSWINCANLYFIVRIDPGFKQLMLGFFQKNISQNITRVADVQLEFAFKKGHKLHPENLLREKGGTRGSGQTSPDVAFILETVNGKGIVLTESKYTEHSFYPCSARRTTDSENKVGNPDPDRCLQLQKGADYKSVCHQYVWGRKYLDYITFSNEGKTLLKHCPAVTAGYQLLRQQSLAEGIAANNSFALVVNSVAFDARNQPLVTCLQSSGVQDFTKNWGDIFSGKTLFKTWAHQQWVEYVRQNGNGKLEKDWVEYLNTRYGY